MAQDKGFFEAAGVRVNLTTTPSSAYQAENLVAGQFQIAGTAFDNVVAYQEGQGAVALQRQPDLFAFMGATQIELAFVVAPDIASYADLKGRSLALDALSTGFAFVLYEMLARGGLARGDYELAPVGATPQRWESVKAGAHAGTLTIEPFTSIARNQGFGCSTPRRACSRAIRAAASRRAGNGLPPIRTRSRVSSAATWQASIGPSRPATGRKRRRSSSAACPRSSRRSPAPSWTACSRRARG